MLKLNTYYFFVQVKFAGMYRSLFISLVRWSWKHDQFDACNMLMELGAKLDQFEGRTISTLVKCASHLLCRFMRHSNVFCSYELCLLVNQQVQTNLYYNKDTQKGGPQLNSPPINIPFQKVVLKIFLR